MRVLMLDGGDRTPYLSRLVARLARAGVTMHYAGDPAWKDFDALAADGVQCHRFGARSKLDFRARRQVRRLLEEHDIGILHTITGRDAYVGIKARGRRPVRVLVRRGAYAKVSRWDPADRVIYRNADRFLVVSDDLRGSLIERGVAADRIRRVYTGIWSEELEPVARDLRAEHGVGPDTLLLALVGQLRPVKGFDYFLAALRDLQARGVDFAVLVAGGGYEDTAGEIADAGLTDRFRMLGFVSDIMTVTPNVDCVVLPSRVDAAPRAAIEATVIGTPVIGTRVGGIPEILDEGRGGVLVDPADPASLAAALERAASDPAHLRACAAHARERNRRLFSLDACVEQHVALYRELLAIQ